VESGLKRDTVGLVHFDDFRRIRQAHEHERMQRVLESEAKKNEEAKKYAYCSLLSRRDLRLELDVVANCESLATNDFLLFFFLSCASQG
jgi:hypothetical protein